MVFTFATSNGGAAVNLGSISVVRSRGPYNSTSIITSNVLSGSTALSVATAARRIGFTCNPTDDVASSTVRSKRALAIINNDTIGSLSSLSPGARCIICMRPVYSNRAVITSCGFAAATRPIRLPFIAKFRGSSRGSG